MHQNTVFPVCLKQISFIALKSIFSLWKLHRNITGPQPFSSHSVIPFSLYIVIAYTKGYGEIIRHTKEIIGYTKDYGENFQEVQKLIKSFLIYS